MSAKRLWDKGKSINKDIHTFTVGSDPIIDKEIAAWDILASAAHAYMLAEQGLISNEDLKKLIPALKSAYKKAEEKKFEIPEDLEDCHTALETYLVNECGDSGKKIHLGRSRNDQVLVATRLYLRNSILTLTKNLLELSKICFFKAANSFETQMPGYTHFQQAMPASVGMWYSAIGENCLELVSEGLHLHEVINLNPLGVASGFSTPLPINREKTTKLLKFRATQRNPINVQNSRGKYETKALNYLSSVSGMIEKFSIDLIMYSMQELAFVKIPEEFTTGSSIMPQKRNPDVLELLRANASKIRALALESDLITSKLPSSYHRDFQYTKEPLIRANELTETSIKIFSEVISSISFNDEILLKTKTPELYATYEAFRLVSSGLTFRDAYRETAKKLEEGKINVEELSKDFKKIALSLDQEKEIALKEIAAFEDAIGKELGELNQIKQDLFK